MGFFQKESEIGEYFGIVLKGLAWKYVPSEVSLHATATRVLYITSTCVSSLRI
jgi:hypothetical protein